MVILPIVCQSATALAPWSGRSIPWPAPWACIVSGMSSTLHAVRASVTAAANSRGLCFIATSSLWNVRNVDPDLRGRLEEVPGFATNSAAGRLSPALQRPEQVFVRLADGEQLRARLQPQAHAAAQVARHCSDGADIDDGGAMYLPEMSRIELRRQLLERAADQRLAAGRDDQRVLGVGLQVAQLIDGDDPHLLARRSIDPSQVGPRLHRSGDLAQHALEFGRRLLHAGLDA